MPNLLPSTLARLTDQLQAFSQGWLAADSVLSIPPQHIMRKWSLMLRFPVKTQDVNTGAVLVKITRHQGGTIEDAIADKSLVIRTKREYEMLRSVERIFSNDTQADTFCHIHPLAVLEEWNALVTEELNCKPLKDYLLTPSMLLGLSQPWQTFEMLLEYSGRWLQIYHQGMGVQEVYSLRQLGLREKFEEYLAQVLRTLTKRDAKHIHGIIDSVLSGVQDLLIPMAVLHGDFHCSNLLVTPDLRVGALDAECVRGPVYEDLAKLLADLETRGLQVYTFGLLILPGRMERARAAVLKGYFASTKANHFLLELFISLAILYKWKIDEDLLVHSAGIQQMVRKILSPVRRRYMLMILNRHLDKLILQHTALSIEESVVAV